jgi:hypothetical protein
VVTFDGPGHGVYHANDCMRTATNAYLLGTAPTRDKTC